MGECEHSLSWPFNPLKHFQAHILKRSFESSLGWIVLYHRPWNMYLNAASCLFFFNIWIREGHTAPSALTSGELSCTHRVEEDARDGHPLSQSRVCECLVLEEHAQPTSASPRPSLEAWGAHGNFTQAGINSGSKLELHLPLSNDSVWFIALCWFRVL